MTRSPAGCWSERTEVHKAASQGQAAELQTLIQSGASVNVVAVDSITPLHEACLRGQAECVRLLLDAGAQVSDGEQSSDTSWVTFFFFLRKTYCFLRHSLA